MKSEEKIAYKQLITILNNMEPEYKEKIPKKLMKLFEENSAEDYEFHLDLTRPLQEQELNSKTLALLAMLNLNYWCETEEEKQELIKHYTENERKYQEELRKKYNTDNIFQKNNRENKQEKTTEEQVALVEHKESIIRRLINKIKSIFHRNGNPRF
mgnify:FL=1